MCGSMWVGEPSQRHLPGTLLLHASCQATSLVPSSAIRRDIADRAVLAFNRSMSAAALAIALAQNLKR